MPSVASWRPLRDSRSAREIPRNPSGRELWSAAGKGRSSDGGSASRKGKRATWITAVGAAAAIAAVTGFVGPFGTDAANRVVGDGAPPARAAGAQRPQPEVLQASARWCCKFSDVEANVGYYWPESPARLTALASGAPLTAGVAGLTPAGSGVIEIPLQTSGNEAIYVGAPKVIVVSRKQNPARGLVAVIPIGGQGMGLTSEYETDLDASTPVTVSYAPGGGQGSGKSGPSYYYVSSGSPDMIILFVTDSKYDMAFDIELSWQAQGGAHSLVLTDGGQPFRMIGSSGLPRYSGDPEAGEKFTRSPDRPLS